MKKFLFWLSVLFAVYLYTHQDYIKSHVTYTVTETTDEEAEPQQQIVNQNQSPPITIPFFYDHGNAPSNLSKSDVLAAISEASNQWTDACNISFEYKGDRNADYVSLDKTFSNTTGIIYWTELDGDTIGEAQMGSEKGPQFGFVLGLQPDFFERTGKAFLMTTILHEMGHVIGLDHSNNKKSVMFAEQRSKLQHLNNSDVAMCNYLRARWQGVSRDVAAEKFNVAFN